MERPRLFLYKSDPRHDASEEIAMRPLLYAMSVETCVPMLRSLSAIFDKAAEQASTRKFDTAVLVNARLAPDMFPFSQQVQIACDHAKGAAARLTGQEPPRFEDNEKTLDELKVRIAKTIAYIESVPAAAFEGAENRQIAMPLNDDLELHANGLQYLRDWVLPHFYFHVVTAYDILRHKGIEIGKRDYLAHVGVLVRPKGGK
jgi:hypothetical protein